MAQGQEEKEWLPCSVDRFCRCGQKLELVGSSGPAESCDTPLAASGFTRVSNCP